MQIPLELSFRNVERTAELERIIQNKAARLDRVCPTLTSCRIAVEKPQESQRSGNPFRVRIDMRVPPGHELVVKNKPRENPIHEGVHAVLNDTFNAAERRLRKLVDQMQGKVKSHPDQEPTAFVTKVFRSKGYGFVRGIDGSEYYFHRNSVLHDDFDRLEPGTGVTMVPEMGEKGPQASSVEIVDKPGGNSR